MAASAPSSGSRPNATTPLALLAVIVGIAVLGGAALAAGLGSGLAASHASGLPLPEVPAVHDAAGRTLAAVHYGYSDPAPSASGNGTATSGQGCGAPGTCPCPSNTTYLGGPAGAWGEYCFSQTVNPNGSTTYCLWAVSSNSTSVPSSPLSCVIFLNSEFGSPCAPIPPGVIVGAYGLNFTFVTTPASGSGPAPLNFTWNASAGGGGLPPYHFVVFIDDAAYSYLSTNASGSVTLTSDGLYEVDAIAFDSSCTQSAFLSLPLQVYGSLGPSPVQITPTVSSPTVPSNVTYAVNSSLLPAGWSVQWDTPGIFSSPTGSGSTWDAQLDGNYTYFFPGTYSATACFVQPDGSVYACGTSPNVTVGGSSPVTTSVSIAPGPYPTNVTYAATLNPGVWLPSGITLDLYATNVSGVGSLNESSGSSVTLTVSEACGYPSTPWVPTAGVCPWPATFTLDGPLGGTDAGYLGGESIVANLTANGTPSTWLPSLSVSYGPMNGSLPLNFTLNFTISGGVAPYYYSYSVLGRTSGAANATFLPTSAGSASGWNGSTVSAVVPLNATGVYWVQVFAADSEDHWVGDSLPLIVLGNVSPLAPLKVQASQVNPVPVVGGGYALFSVSVSGGLGPYAVQWAFGDGSYASSIPGVPVSHTYAAPGTYDPTVTVTGAGGRSVTVDLAPVVVSPAPASGHAPATPLTSGPAFRGDGLSFAWVPVLAAAAIAALLLLVGLLRVRSEARDRREGEALLEEAGRFGPGGAAPPSAPPAP